jgi:hypothetical protein
MLLMFVLLMLPLLALVFIGVAVLIGVGVAVFMVLEVFVVVFVLFAFSLAQPIPKAATASKVRRAKVLRIELSPVTQRVRLLGSWAEVSSRCPLECFRFSSVHLFEPHEVKSLQPRGVTESKHTGQFNCSQPLMPALNYHLPAGKF